MEVCVKCQCECPKCETTAYGGRCENCYTGHNRPYLGLFAEYYSNRFSGYFNGRPTGRANGIPYESCGGGTRRRSTTTSSLEYNNE